MAVLVTVEVNGQTEAGYTGMRAFLTEIMKSAKGFVLHAAHPTEDGWRVTEVWETLEAANQFFAKHVVPNLPPGVRPKRSVQELHDVVHV